MTRVITYQLAYRTDITCDLCPACVERDDHDCGVLGAIQHGLHSGTCVGAAHQARRLAYQLFRDDLSRADEVPVATDGRKAYDGWLRASSDAGDTETREALEAVDREEFAEVWDECVANEEQRS